MKASEKRCSNMIKFGRSQEVCVMFGDTGTAVLDGCVNAPALSEALFFHTARKADGHTGVGVKAEILPSVPRGP